MSILNYRLRGQSFYLSIFKVLKSKARIICMIRANGLCRIADLCCRILLKGIGIERTT